MMCERLASTHKQQPVLLNAHTFLSPSSKVLCMSFDATGHGSEPRRNRMHHIYMESCIVCGRQLG